MEEEGRSGGTEERSLTALWLQAILVLAAGVLGFWGWMDLYGSWPFGDVKPYSDFGYRVLDSIAATLGLYATSFSLPPLPKGVELGRDVGSEMGLLNWQLIAARILAPLTLLLVVVWALVKGFFGISLRIKATKTGLRSKSGLVICGSGDLVEDTAIQESLRAGRKPNLMFPRRLLNASKVTWVQHWKRGCRKSPDGSPEYWPIVIVSAFMPERIAELRTLGIKWIPADARRPDVLQSMGLFRARAIAALDPDVSWNTDVARRAEKVAGQEGYTESHVVARAGRNPVIPWTEEERVEGAVTVTPFDFDDIAARAVLEKIDPFPGLDRGICQGERVLVVATDEPAGDSLIIEGIRSWVAQHPLTRNVFGAPSGSKATDKWAGDRLRVLLIGTNATDRIERILAHEPEIPRLLSSEGVDDKGRVVIAGWDRPPDYIGDDSEWFGFVKGSKEAAIGPREVPTVLVYSLNRHKAARAARDTSRLPKVLARQGRVVAVTESGILDEHLKEADGFETVDTGRLLSNISLYIDGGYEQRLARSLHARWRQRGSRKSIGEDDKVQTPTDYFREMLGTWEELTQEEEAQWLLLAEYLLEGYDATDSRLGGLTSWEQAGLGYVVDRRMQDLSKNPSHQYLKTQELVGQLEFDKHPDLVPGAFLEAGISLEESGWASSLNHAMQEAADGSREAASYRVAEAFRGAEKLESTHGDGDIEAMFLEALRKIQSSANKSARSEGERLPERYREAFTFVRRNVKRIGEAREGVK